MSLPQRVTPTRRTTQLTDMPRVADLVGNALKFLRLNATEDAYELSAVAGAYQPLDADLTAIAALASTDGNFIVGSPAGWVAESGATARNSLGLGTTDTPQFAREGLGVAADATDILKILSAATANASKGLEITHSGVIGSGNVGYAAWLTKSGAGVGTNIGLRLTASGATGANYPLALENNQAAAGRNAANTAWQELLKLNTSDYLEILTSLVAGPLIFESDTGRTWLADMGISATPGAGTEMSYGFLLDANEVLRVYGEANGSGALQNPRIEIWNVVSALTNAPTFPARIAHLTSGTPAAGIGVGLEFYQETSADNYEILAQIAAIAEVVTGGSEDGAIIFYTMEDGAAPAEALRIGPGGAFTTPQDATQTVANDAAIAVAGMYLRVAGSGGAVVLDTDPAVAAGRTGQIVVIEGANSTNTVQIADGANVQLAHASKVTLKAGDTLPLLFNGTDWIELAGSNRLKVLYVSVVAPATALTTGDGKAYITIPDEYNGMDLVAAHAAVYTASTSGTPTVMIHNATDVQDMLSTAITLDINEFSSYTAATPPVVNASFDDVVTGDRLRVDVDVAGTGTQGLDVVLTFRMP